MTARVIIIITRACRIMHEHCKPEFWTLHTRIIYMILFCKFITVRLQNFIFLGNSYFSRAPFFITILGITEMHFQNSQAYSNIYHLKAKHMEEI